MTSLNKFAEIEGEDEQDDNGEYTIHQWIEEDTETSGDSLAEVIVDLDFGEQFEVACTSVQEQVFHNDAEEDDYSIASLGWDFLVSETLQGTDAMNQIPSLSNQGTNALNNEVNNLEMDIDPILSPTTVIGELTPEYIDSQFHYSIVWDVNQYNENIRNHQEHLPTSTSMANQPPSLLMSIEDSGTQVDVLDDLNIEAEIRVVDDYNNTESNQDYNAILNYMNVADSSIQDLLISMNPNALYEEGLMQFSDLPTAWLENVIAEGLTTSTDLGSAPLDQEQIDKLEMFTIRTDIDSSGIIDKECSICMELLVVNDEVVRLPKCKHVFHRRCIVTWLNRRSSCPLCRCKVSVERDRVVQESSDDASTHTLDPFDNIILSDTISDSITMPSSTFLDVDGFSITINVLAEYANPAHVRNDDYQGQQQVPLELLINVLPGASLEPNDTDQANDGQNQSPASSSSDPTEQDTAAGNSYIYLDLDTGSLLSRESALETEIDQDNENDLRMVDQSEDGSGE